MIFLNLHFISFDPYSPMKIFIKIKVITMACVHSISKVISSSSPPPPKKKVPYFQKVHAFKLPSKLKLMTYTSSTLLHHSSCVKCKK